MNKHLNEKTEWTEKIIHLAITTLCDRKCKYCCNNWYSWNEVEQVTSEELSKAEIICLTGGEPFAYGNPVAIAHKLKKEYSNIKKVYIYTNAKELYNYLHSGGKLTVNSDYGDESIICDIDGLNISIKNKADIDTCLALKNYPEVGLLSENRLYVFNHLITKVPVGLGDNCKLIHREWQKEFIPANDSIFRRI